MVADEVEVAAQDDEAWAVGAGAADDDTAAEDGVAERPTTPPPLPDDNGDALNGAPDDALAAEGDDAVVIPTTPPAAAFTGEDVPTFTTPPPRPLEVPDVGGGIAWIAAVVPVVAVPPSVVTAWGVRGDDDEDEEDPILDAPTLFVGWVAFRSILIVINVAGDVSWKKQQWNLNLLDNQWENKV